MARVLSSFLAFLGLAGCQPSARQEPRSIKELIESHQSTSLGESIGDVSRHLASCEVLLPTVGLHQQGEQLQLKVAPDVTGSIWVYAYTDEAELLAAFPEGCPFVGMRFGAAFKMVASDPKFGGIFINQTDGHRYLIPREVFDMVQAELDRAPDASGTSE